MPILGALLLLIQFSFAYHVFKTGRPYWWMFVIMAFPVMGCLIYYFVEVFPGSRQHRTAHKAARNLVRSLQPDAELKRRAEELAICGSVDNKAALARECLAHQMHTEAIQLYESCLQGAFSDDAPMLFALTHAAVEGREWAKAADALDRLQAHSSPFRVAERELLRVRVLDGKGDTDAAIAGYKKLIPEFSGLEARYRYAELLARLGQHEAATQVLNELLAHAKRFNLSVESEQVWIGAAKRAVTQG